MIEAVMYAAIGFMVATLLALLILPAVWRRAVRLTTKRIEGAIPVSVAEIQADKDQLRAEFAMSTRRLERDAEILRIRSVEQFDELARQATGLAALRAELDSRNAELAALGTQNQEFLAARATAEQQLGIRTQELEQHQAALAATREELATATARLSELDSLSESLRVEAVALSTERDSARDRAADLERELATVQALLADDRSSLRQTIETLSAERSNGESLAAQLAGTVEELARSRAEAETRAATIAALEAEGLRLAARTEAADAARGASEAEAARLTGEADAARHEAEATARQLRNTLEMIRAEKAMLEGALAKAREDRSQIQTRLAALETAALGSANRALADEHIDNALLRERISDVAAEVARLTATLEGPGSPIESLLAAETPANGVVSLGDRVRALQARAGR